jgi:hypothetical protein
MLVAPPQKERIYKSKWRWELGIYKSKKHEQMGIGFVCRGGEVGWGPGYIPFSGSSFCTLFGGPVVCKARPGKAPV